MSIEKPTVTADSIPPDWIEIVREIIRRDGIAVRAGINSNTIELKSLRNNQWQPMMLHGSGNAFTTPQDRDTILSKLTS